jgi:hypothetical protein
MTTKDAYLTYLPDRAFTELSMGEKKGKARSKTGGKRWLD